MAAKHNPKRTYDAHADTLDFRDMLYQATLVEVPPRIDIQAYKQLGVPILDQKTEGACTGFGLATVANYLLRTRRVGPEADALVSPRMIYEMAKRYDEYPGENYEGSSARGAMKGWFKHGVCSSSLWKYVPGQSDRNREMSNARIQDAAHRPLGAYYRVNHKDLVAMHSALAEVGILYATGNVHTGWEPGELGADGLIQQQDTLLGGHAFAIVAYDERGFWVQNSWGPGWGAGGFGQVTYDDWMANGLDVWVARLGVPIQYAGPAGSKQNVGTAQRALASGFIDLRGHIISLGDGGLLQAQGQYGTSQADVERIFTQDFQQMTQSWPKKRLLFYAHGGLVSQDAAIQQAADYRDFFLNQQIYPVCFIWHTDLQSTLENIVRDAFNLRRPACALESGLQDFLLDRLDDSLEPLVRNAGGKAVWDEIKKNALLATTGSQGGAALALSHVDQLMAHDPSVEIHFLAHSAGSIFQGPMVQLLSTRGSIAGGPLQGRTGLGRSITTCNLWAPACQTQLFHDFYLPVIHSGGIQRFALYTLTDSAERADNCDNIYHKSIMYLVSNALEQRAHIPGIQDGQPLLGMEKFIRQDPAILGLLDPASNWVLAPSADNLPAGSPMASKATNHSAFNEDPATRQATLARILGLATATASVVTTPSAAAAKTLRKSMVMQAR